MSKLHSKMFTVCLNAKTVKILSHPGYLYLVLFAIKKDSNVFEIPLYIKSVSFLCNINIFLMSHLELMASCINASNLHMACVLRAKVSFEKIQSLV